MEIKEHKNTIKYSAVLTGDVFKRANTNNHKEDVYLKVTEGIVNLRLNTFYPSDEFDCSPNDEIVLYDAILNIE